LIAAIVLGPRIGRFYDIDGIPLEEPHSFPPHNAALQILGTFILWFGWYGFNPGSILVIDTEDGASVAALCAVTTTLAAASGAVSAMFVDSILDSIQTGEISYDLSMAMNGCLSGLVAITAGCSVVAPWASILIGAIGGVVYLAFSKLLVKLKIDDAVDAIPVHFANGIWGVLATGLFANATYMAPAGYNVDHEGWFYSWGKGSGDANLLLAQFTCIVWIIGWVTCLMFPFFYVLNKANMFRVDAIEEEVGMDISHHRGPAYHIETDKTEDNQEQHPVKVLDKVEEEEQAPQGSDVAEKDTEATEDPLVVKNAPFRTFSSEGSA